MSARALSLRAYAAHRRRLGLPGGTLHAVQVALEYGRIPRGANGKIDPVAADLAWLATTDPAKRPPAPDRAGELEASAPVAAIYTLRELLAEIHEPLFKVSGPRRVVEAIVTRWAKLPEVLDQLEDGMRAAGVPLLAQDMPESDEHTRARTRA